ncbi:hypothetical protein Gotur_010700 [Gossypium turneri]
MQDGGWRSISLMGINLWCDFNGVQDFLD